VPVDILKEQWKLPEVELHAMDLDGNFADDLVQKAGAFDAVMAVEILEHVENPFSFIRQCSRLLRPGGKLFLTTPNVETPRSRVLFLLTGRLITFGVGETERLSHITPIFGWKLRMMLAEAGFVCRIEKFKPEALLPSANYKVKFTSIAARLLAPFMKGEKNDATRLVVAELGEVE
jgi:2-polyprenyl-3-methyl-5-hydroxy-6-metoxy-1,4-benzoquinol methylase